MKPIKMQPSGPWRGVRMRRAMAAPDPDAAPRPVTLVATWDDRAAAALAALVPGTGPAHLEQAAEAWIGPLAERARQAGFAHDFGARLRSLLLRRRGAPTAPVWRGEATDPCFCLNLAAFHEPAMGFDLTAFAEAAETATWALALAAPSATRIAVGFSDLAGLLSALGVEYDSAAARDIAAGLAALLRAATESASADLADIFGATARRPHHGRGAARRRNRRHRPRILAAGRCRAADAGSASVAGGTGHDRRSGPFRRARRPLAVPRHVARRARRDARRRRPVLCQYAGCTRRPSGARLCPRPPRLAGPPHRQNTKGQHRRPSPVPAHG
jgi:hypothetical protein